MRPSWDYRHVVTLEETNAVGNVYFVSYLRWQGHCRELFLEERAPGVLAALREGLALVTTRCSCEYFAELDAFDRVLVRMTLAGLRHNRLVMRFEYVREQDGDVVARGEQEIACMAREDAALRPTPVPTELSEALAPYARDGGARASFSSAAASRGHRTRALSSSPPRLRSVAGARPSTAGTSPSAPLHMRTRRSTRCRRRSGRSRAGRWRTRLGAPTRWSSRRRFTTTRTRAS